MIVTVASECNSLFLITDAMRAKALQDGKYELGGQPVKSCFLKLFNTTDEKFINCLIKFFIKNIDTVVLF